MTTTIEKKTTTATTATATEKKAPAKKRPVRKSPAKKATEKTAKTATKKSVKITGVTEPVDYSNVDWEFQRTHQSKPMQADDIAILLDELKKLGFSAEAQNKAYYGIKVAFEGRPIAIYWAKRDFPRLILTPKRLEGAQLPINLSPRQCKKHESRGSEILIDCPNEYVVTPDEAIAILKSVADAKHEIKSKDVKKSQTVAK